MSGFLDGFAESTIPTVATNPLVQPPSSLHERLSASVGELMAPDHWYMQGQERFHRWEAVRGALKEKTGEDLPNPYETAPGYKELAKYGGNHEAMQAARSTSLIQAIRLAREQFPDLPDAELIDRQMAEESRRLRTRAHELEDTGHGFGNFLGTGLAATVIDPTQAALLLFPGTSIGIPAEMAVKGFLFNAAKEAAYQGGSQMIGAAAGQTLDYWARKPLGTQQTFGEAAETVAGAGAGGAILGAGARSLHLYWNKWRTEAVLGKNLDHIPPEVRAAANIVEAKELYEANNPLGVQPASHEAAMNKATADLAQGKPVSVAPILAQEATPLAKAETAMEKTLREAVEAETGTAGHTTVPERPAEGGIPPGATTIADPAGIPPGRGGAGRRGATDGRTAGAPAAPEAPGPSGNTVEPFAREAVARVADLPDQHILTLALTENPERGKALAEAQNEREKLSVQMIAMREQLDALQRKEGATSPLAAEGDKPKTIRDIASEEQLNRLDELQMAIDSGSAAEIKAAKAEMAKLKTALLKNLRAANDLPTTVAETSKLVDLEKGIAEGEKNLRMVEARVKHEEAGLVKEIEAMRERLRSGQDVPKAEVFAAADRSLGEETRPVSGQTTAEVPAAAREVPDDFTAVDLKQADAVLAERSKLGDSNLGVSRKELDERLAEVNKLLADAKLTKKGNPTKKSIALQQEKDTLLAMQKEMDAAKVTSCAEGAII